jgi:hypothetical protein
MITPHVRPDTDTYRFTVTQITLASETFPAGADHCVTEPCRGAAPGSTHSCACRARPGGGGKTPVHVTAGALSGWRTPWQRICPSGRPSVRAAGQNCPDDPGERRFGLPAGQMRRQPGPGPGSRRPDLPHTPSRSPDSRSSTRMRRLFHRTLPRKCGFVGASSGPPPAGTLRSGTRRYPAALAAPVSIRRRRQHPPAAAHPSGSSGRRTAGPSGRLRSSHRRPRPRKNRLTRPGRPEARRCEAPRNGVLAERPVGVGTEVSGIQ